MRSRRQQLLDWLLTMGLYVLGVLVLYALGIFHAVYPLVGAAILVGIGLLRYGWRIVAADDVTRSRAQQDRTPST